MNASSHSIEIGTSVHYWPSTAMVATQRITLLNAERPLHATVAHVYHDRMVNLVVYDHTGRIHAITSVSVVYPGEIPEEGRDYCEIARPAGCCHAKSEPGETDLHEWPVLPNSDRSTAGPASTADSGNDAEHEQRAQAAFEDFREATITLIELDAVEAAGALCSALVSLMQEIVTSQGGDATKVFHITESISNRRVTFNPVS